MADDNEVKIKVTTEADTSEVESLETTIDNAKNSADELGNSISNIDSSNVGNVATEFDEAGSSADKADNEVQEFQGSLDLLDASALLSISSELSNIGSQAEGMAQEMNTAAISVGQLATQTGIAEPQMISLINNISNATFPNDEAMMYVKSLDQIGVSASNLGKSATDLDKINDAFHLGAERTNSLGQELSVLGVDMNNVSSSFNALAYANANTVGGMENYYTFLRKYDAQFKELGFNVDQASVIIAAATQKFGGGRAALSGLSTALKNANGDTRALEQALGLQAGSLDNASALTGQYAGQLQALADEEAEHKTIVDQLGAAWEDLSLSLSPVLEPMASVMGLIGQAGSWAVGVNGLIQLAQTTKVATAAQWLWNAAMAANPITLVVIAIVALIAVLGYLYFNNEQVRSAIDGLGQTLMWVAGVIYDSIVGAFEWLSNLFTDFTSQIGLNTNDWTQAILGFILFFPQLPMRVGQLLLDTIAHALGFGDNFTSSMYNAAWDAYNSFVDGISGLSEALQEEIDAMIHSAQNFANDLPDYFKFGGLGAVIGWIGSTGEHSPGFMYQAFQGELNAMLSLAAQFLAMLPSYLLRSGSNGLRNFRSGIAGLAQALSTELSQMISDALNFAGRIGSILWNAGINAITNFLNALDRHSPGIMQREFIAELTETGQRIPSEGKLMVRNMGRLGSDVVDSFHPELSDVGFANNSTGSGGVGQVVNFYFSDIVVDDDKRMQRIVDYITRELNFDNATAGRWSDI